MGRRIVHAGFVFPLVCATAASGGLANPGRLVDLAGGSENSKARHRDDPAQPFVEYRAKKVCALRRESPRHNFDMFVSGMALSAG